MKNIIQLSAVAGLAALVIAGCGGGGSGSGFGGNGDGNDNRSQTFSQKERLARPVVNEVFATVANNQHLINDTINPPQDPQELAPDIQSFMKSPAGRSDDVANFVTSVLVPDVMIADLSKRGEAAYLGFETGGKTSATGSTFGGRKLQDDVVDMSLGIIFGKTLATLNPALDDGKETPSLTSDNVGPSKMYLNSFPYLPDPR